MENLIGNDEKPETLQKRLHWIVIKKNHHEELYRRIDIPSKVFLKWFWFFRYRAAIYQVKFPKANIMLDHGSSVAEIRQQEMIEQIVKDCQANGTRVFVKQLGTHLSKELKLSDRHGGNIEEWPEQLRVRQFPLIRQ